MPDSPDLPDDALLVSLCDALIHSRQHVGPKHLAEPGPDEATLRDLLAAAAAAPDHGRITPWRFLVLGPQARQRLSQVFVDSLLARDPQAYPDQVEDARKKAFRGPVLLMAIARLDGLDPDIPAWERLLSLGAALQNLLLAAQARGLGSGVTSGRALQCERLRQAFDIAPGEQAVCFITLGTPSRSKPARPRPAVEDFVTWI
ncbi:nitroreductase family protein [Ideonella livida]|uniref:Putative NAD(P)H nitroreductase n=1 Tax=Ideonella livida TaxID=2707176 RepID=A0A7C9TM87_9BURK|nr:nitroreductase family protein [Ideonella livida]NDY91486.1 nitroreductase [Ideonella livida]